MELSDVYQNSKKLLLKCRAGVDRLELSGAGGEWPELAAGVGRDLQQIQMLCSQMDSHIAFIPNKPNRDLWKRKVEQVAEEAISLKASLDKYYEQNQKRSQEARERAELLGRASGESSHILRIFDEEAQAMQSARNSSRVLEESYATGVAILAQYAGQKERLKSAQRKALDVLNTVGLSNSVLRLIERRSRIDKWIKYVGMFFTVVILISFWRWTR